MGIFHLQTRISVNSNKITLLKKVSSMKYVCFPENGDGITNSSSSSSSSSSSTGTVSYTHLDVYKRQVL